MIKQNIPALVFFLVFGGVLTWAIIGQDPLGYGIAAILIVLFGGYQYLRRNRAKLTGQIAGQIKRQTAARLTEAAQKPRTSSVPNGKPQKDEDPHILADFSPDGLQGVGLRMNGPDGSVTLTDPMAIAQQAVGLQTAQELNKLLDKLEAQGVSPDIVARSVDNVLRDMEQVRTQREVAPQNPTKRIAVDVNSRPGIQDPFGEYQGWRRK